LSNFATSVQYFQDVIDEDENDEDNQPRTLRGPSPSTTDIGRRHDDYEFRLFFRFKKGDFNSLLYHLKIPKRLRLVDLNCYVDGAYALLLTLAKYAHGFTYAVMGASNMFNRSTSFVCSVVNGTVHYLYRRWVHRVRMYVSNFSNQRIEYFKNVVANKSGIQTDIFAFVDGTTRRIARPIRNQRAVFSGHKKIHCLKYQAISTPDGLISSLSEAVVGRMHDSKLFFTTSVWKKLVPLLIETSSNLLGDKGYSGDYSRLPGGSHLKAMSKYNKSDEKKLSPCRVAVEDVFAEVTRYFKMCDNLCMNRALQSALGEFYTVAVLLTNCRTCLYKNPINSLYGTEPDDLETYLGEYIGDFAYYDTSNMFDGNAGFFEEDDDFPNLNLNSD